MAIILEDFEDDTFVITITGTWTRDSEFAAAGSYSLRSAVITDDETTDAKIAIPAGATSVSFRYKVWSEEDYDEFFVLIDGAAVLQASGNIDWTAPVTFNVTGASELTFRYTKDSSVFSGRDAAWVDQIEFTVPGTEVAGADVGALTETVVSVVPAPEVAKASSDSATLVEARWASEPEGGSEPPSVRSSSVVAAGTATYTIAAPAAVALNDMMFALQAADRGSTSVMTTPTGGTEWQPLDALDGEGEFGVLQVIRLWWKRAGSNEPSQYTFKQMNGSDGVCVIVAVKDASLNVSPLFERSTDGTGQAVTTPGIAPTSATDLELRIIAVSALGTSLGFTPPDGLDPVANVQSRTYTAAAAAARALLSNAPTEPANFVASANAVDWRVGYTLAIAPAVTGPPQEPHASSDAATLIEAAQVIEVPAGEPVAADDSATLTETAAATADVVTSDLAALVEALTVEAGTTADDQAALAEAATLEVGWLRSDQAVIADTAQVDARAAAADTGALTESSAIDETVGPVSSDAAGLAEAAAVDAQAAAADSGALGELVEVAVLKDGSDSGQLVESVLLDLASSDSAALAEAVQVEVSVAADDGAVITDLAVVEAPRVAADSGALVETATVVNLGREVGGLGPMYRRWSAGSPYRRHSAGEPRRAWGAGSPRT
ncbi:hypothetical protein [Nonomuraea sp. NPDC049504]|uniref:hypothetical protein n=1 Tax=Nonomuraea sp. NPDC049504 TaxID=3154729 RepID=UPI00341DA1CE